MTAQIIGFPPAVMLTPPLAQFVRVGDAHKKLSELVGMGRFPADRVVLQASRLPAQKRLLGVLREAGAELVLDPQVAELASLKKFKGQERHSPWGVLCNNQPLGPEHFARGAASDVVGQIARMAVENKFDVVLSPTHYLADPHCDNWLAVDRVACVELRHALDREGGTHIRIDYPVLHLLSSLYRSDVRSEILHALDDLPFDNLWLRSSGAEGIAGPDKIKSVLIALSGMHNLGRPVILDYLGGMLSVAAMAFGVASGRALGIGEMERFDASDWHKAPKPQVDGSSSFGRTVRYAVSDLGKALTEREIRTLAEASGGRRLLAGHLRSVGDLFQDGREHQLARMAAERVELEKVPLLRRDDWFLRHPMQAMVRKSRSIAELKPSVARGQEHNVDVDAMMKRLREHARTVEKTQIALENIQQTRAEDAPRARPVSQPRTPNKERKWETP